MTERETADLLKPLAFESFGALRRWHSEQLRRLRTEGPLSAGLARHYVHAVEASGAVIASEDERLSAQDILDYWSAELISAAPSENQSWSPPRLAGFASGGDGPGVERQVGEGASDGAKARIRLAASARLWRDSGYKKGYLLFGQALAEARHFKDDDPDIAELIQESEVYERKLTRGRRLLKGAAIFVAVSIAFLLGAIHVWNTNNELREARASLEVAALSADLAQQKIENERDLAEDRSREALKALINTRNRNKDVEAAIALNTVLLDLVRREVEGGRIDEASIPPSVRSALASLTVVQQVDQSLGASSNAGGYIPELLKVPLPMPAHAEGGATLAYPNYSILMHRTRRMALVAASSVDRQKLRVLPRSRVGFACDIRLPCDQQASPAWFSGEFDRGHLVPGSQVAWGPDIEGLGLDAASLRLTGAVNLYPNVTPQLGAFNRGVWDQAEQWALTEHNKAASQLAIFTGPVLRGDDPVISGVQAPRAFWKIVASSRFERAGGLVVDAFMVPHLKDGTAVGAASTQFQPDLFRTTVADIEQATGLHFGPDLRQTTARPSQVAAPGGLSARISEINAPGAPARIAATQRLVTALQDPEVAGSAKRALVAAAVALASGTGAAALSPSGRINLVVLLSEVPAATWDNPDWLASKALARRMVATLEAQAGVTTEPIGPRAAGLIATLKANLDWDLPKGRTVHFQLYGTGQPGARDASRDLGALGWSVLGEENGAEARGRNGVYYAGPADLPAAVLLAADLRAMGYRQIGPPQPVPGGKPGTLEAWVSP